MIVNPYGGPGGWDVGLQELGLDCVGIEIDSAACLTRAAAGHRTIRADVAAFPLDHLVGRVDGVILSPPCQAFSTAGNGEGRDALPDLNAAIRRGDWGWSHDDDRVRHVLEVGRWVETLRPRWVACEQVPPVLPVWQAYASRWSYIYDWSTWAGILNAADYGVPQTRRRAFLIARTDGGVAAPPAPTHCEGGALTLDGELAPWVSMADALGWTGEDAPARTLAGNRSPRWLYPDSDGTHGRVLDRRQQSDGVPVRLVDCDTEPAPTLTGIAGAKSQWVFRQPATTIVGDGRAFGPHSGSAGEPQSSNAIRLTIRDALILQGFDPAYPVQGTRTKQFEQVGNAVPPPLAAAVIGALAHHKVPVAV